MSSWCQRSNFQRSKVPPSFLDGPNYSWSWRKTLILVFWKRWKFRKKSISISANCKQKRDLNLKKVLETSIQRAIRSVVSIGCFILDFYFFPPNFESSVQIKSSSIDSSNIKNRFQSKTVSETSAKDISEIRKRGLQLEIIFWIFYFFDQISQVLFKIKSSLTDSSNLSQNKMLLLLLFDLDIENSI